MELIRNYQVWLWKHRWSVLFLLLVIVTTLLRMYKLSEWFFFNTDEDSYSFIFRKIAFLHRPVLVSYEIPGGLLAPPVVYYFGALILLLSSGNPLGLALTSSLFGILSVILTYVVGRRIFKSEVLTIFATTIYCFSYFINIYSRLAINLPFGPILSLLTYLSLYFIVKKGKKAWIWPLAIFFIGATQEGSMISLIFLGILSLLILRRKSSLSYVFGPFLLFLSSFVPVFIFDLRHNFLVSQKFLHFFLSADHTSFKLTHFIEDLRVMSSALTRMVIVSGPNDINLQILPCTQYIEIIRQHTPFYFTMVGFLVILFFVIMSFSKKAVFGQKILSLHILITIVGLLVYSLIMPGYTYEWFFHMLLPAFSFILAYVIFFFTRFNMGKILVTAFFVIFIFLNLKLTISGTAVAGYKDKFSAVQFASSYVGDKEFEVKMLGNGCNGFGYRYLFTYFGKEPTTSYVDNQYVGWLYQKSVKSPPRLSVIIIPIIDLDTDTLKKTYATYKSFALAGRKFGNIEVLITPLE